MNLLPPDTLAGVRLGISASSSPDLHRIGLLEDHFRLALGEVARTVLVLGGSLQYCGHLDPGGYTTFLIAELKRYGGRQVDRFSVVLPWSVHRRLSLPDIRRAEKELGLFGEFQYLDEGGVPIECAAGRGDPPAVVPEAQIAPSLSGMRLTATRQTQGRLFLGGRRTGYKGVMPGVLEEALLALTARQPIFLAGGFGGVTHDLVGEFDRRATAWLPSNDVAIDDGGLRVGLERIAALSGGKGWEALSNGLDAAENAQLAATHRCSEIAAFVSLGLGRLAAAGAFSPSEPPSNDLHTNRTDSSCPSGGERQE